MTNNVEGRPTGAVVDDLIAILAKTTHARVVEVVADRLGAAGDRRAIRPLLMCLGSLHVQDNTDVEDAVCRALEALGVMCSTGNLSFCLRPCQALDEDVVETIRELAGMVSGRYYGTQQIEGARVRPAEVGP